MEMKPIGFFRTRKKNPYEAARQGSAEISDEIGEIHLLAGQMFDQALDGIEGFSHLWVLFQFHHNSNWKPKVLPPRGSQGKIGVFATRSPYRPNPVGLSCVELLERKGLVLKIKNFDLLDETPIFDIKPYLAYADSVPHSRAGWLEGIEKEKFHIEILPKALKEIEKLESLGVPEVLNFLNQQLSFDPLNKAKKRVLLTGESSAVLCYRTWRIEFEFELKEGKIKILGLYSGYSADELAGPSDPHHDKDHHRSFIQWQNQRS